MIRASCNATSRRGRCNRPRTSRARRREERGSRVPAPRAGFVPPSWRCPPSARLYNGDGPGRIWCERCARQRRRDPAHVPRRLRRGGTCTPSALPASCETACFSPVICPAFCLQAATMPGSCGRPQAWKSCTRRPAASIMIIVDRAARAATCRGSPFSSNNKVKAMTLELRRRVPTHVAAEMLGVAPATLKAWRLSGRGPRFAKLGARVVYDIRDLEKFLASRRRYRTTDAVPAAA